MKRKRRSGPSAREPVSFYHEAGLLARLAEEQGRLVSDVLARAARSERVSRQKERLARDLGSARVALEGNLDRLRELHHRVRNHLQMVMGPLSAQERSERSATARRALRTSIARLASFAAIHDLLARDPRSGELRLAELAERLARHLLSQAGAEERLRVHIEVEPVSLAAREGTAFVLILTELISNAIEHGFPGEAKGKIRVHLARRGEEAELEVRDNGRGLPAGFSLEHSESLGLQLVARLAERDLGGSATAHRRGGGACFRVVFPMRDVGKG